MKSTQQLVEALMRAIDDGRYPVGSLLPSESQLQQEFDVTRYRMREAMATLRKLGVVDSRAGVGTQVLARGPAPFFVHSQQTLDTIVEAARATHLRVHRSGMVRTDERLAGLLRTEPGTTWFFMDTVRYLRGDSMPIGALWLYIRPEYAGIAPRVESWSDPVFKLIEQMFDVQVAAVDQEIDADRLEEGLAARLQASAGSPCLRVTRHWLDAAANLVQCSVGIYPQSRSRYRSRLQLGRSE